MGTAKLPKPMVPTKAANQPINSDDMGRDSGVASPALFAQHFRYATEFRKMRKELCAREERGEMCVCTHISLCMHTHISH
jgi:hypothetical protein